jgi:hypothetical protein
MFATGYWYEKITNASAEYHLTVNFHCAFNPRGMNRTYPKQIILESILGNEYNRWSSRFTSLVFSSRFYSRARIKSRPTSGQSHLFGHHNKDGVEVKGALPVQRLKPKH